jgi:hypothetical protein
MATKPNDPNDAWQATRAMTNMATRLMGSDAYLGRDAQRVGLSVGEGRHEIFAACPPAEALRMQLEERPAAYIAVHDLGGQAAHGLLASLSMGLQLTLQRLLIRRQGSGVTLATIEFVELPLGGGQALRVYSTHVDADSAARKLIGETLLAFSRLGVLLIGAMPPHALHASLLPLRERVQVQPWTNRQLLLVPMSGNLTELPALARQLVAGTVVEANTTAVAPHPSAAWAQVQSAWDLARGDPAAVAAPPTVDPMVLSISPATPAAPLPMRPMPAPSTSQATGPAEAQLERYVKAAAGLRGAIDACIFRIVDRRVLAHAGRHADGQAIAAQGASLIAAGLRAAAGLGAGHSTLDAQLTLDDKLLVARVLPQSHSLGLLAIFERAHCNPATIGAHLQRLEPLLDVHS